MSKRERIAHLVDGAGLSSLLLRARRLVPPTRLPIVTYHRVRDDAEGHPFDDGVIDATPAQLDAQMALVRAHFNPIGARQLAAWAAGASLPPNPICITFDDGYRDNLDTAVPILQRHGVPAIFFVTTGFIEGTRIFWWDRVAYLVKASQAEALDLTVPEPRHLPLGTHRAASLRACLRIIKDTPGLDLDAFLDDLGRAAGVPWSADEEAALAREQIMSWDDVRRLHRLGMDVQSHTRSHRVLGTLPAHELDDELSGSKAALEAELGAPVDIVSYPVGTPADGRPDIVAALERAGYALGLTNGTGVNSLLRAPDRWSVRRVCADRNTSLPLYRASLAMPFLAA